MKPQNFFLIGFLILFSFMIMNVWMHEQVHVAINHHAGIDSEISVQLYQDWLPTLAVSKLNTPTKEIDIVNQLHLQNEIVNYNLVTPLFGIMFILILGFGYLGDKK